MLGRLTIGLCGCHRSLKIFGGQKRLRLRLVVLLGHKLISHIILLRDRCCHIRKLLQSDLQVTLSCVLVELLRRGGEITA